VTGDARAFWVTGPGAGEIRAEPVPAAGPRDVLVRTLCTAVSRGTERLVFEGRVPAGQRDRMRAPFQSGDFPWPVKYGYLSVGTVEEGPEALLGHVVFCLHPHQSRFVVPADAVSLVPGDVPPRRAVLAGTVETAVTALWEVSPTIGDRVTVVGAGMVGCCIARLLTDAPGVAVTLVDVDPTRSSTAHELGVPFALPGEAPDDQDVVFHTSATAAGLATSLRSAATDGAVVEVSWYGDGDVGVPLGGDFHSRRLTLRAAQVGGIPPGRRGRWTHEARRALALELLRDPGFDVLLTGSSTLDELPEVMTGISRGTLPGICHTISYQ
jgi:NADPH:quinone reductase-like Zn-dependent oxidoreductase